MEKIGSLDQAVKERDKSIMDLNQTIETMNKAEQHFHSQEVKNESEQAKYADRQMERKAEVQKQLVAAGNVRQRIPADTQRLLRESISEFNADRRQRLSTLTPKVHLCAGCRSLAVNILMICQRISSIQKRC